MPNDILADVSALSISKLLMPKEAIAASDVPEAIIAPRTRWKPASARKLPSLLRAAFIILPPASSMNAHGSAKLPLCMHSLSAVEPPSLVSRMTPLTLFLPRLLSGNIRCAAISHLLSASIALYYLYSYI